MQLDFQTMPPVFTFEHQDSRDPSHWHQAAHTCTELYSLFYRENDLPPHPVHEGMRRRVHPTRCLCQTLNLCHLKIYFHQDQTPQAVKTQYEAHQTNDFKHRKLIIPNEAHENSQHPCPPLVVSNNASSSIKNANWKSNLQPIPFSKIQDSEWNSQRFVLRDGKNQWRSPDIPPYSDPAIWDRHPSFPQTLLAVLIAINTFHAAKCHKEAKIYLLFSTSHDLLCFFQNP